MEFFQFIFPCQQMKGGAFLGTCFGQNQFTTRKMKRSEATTLTSLCSTFVPVKSAGDHEMEDKPQIFIEPNAYAFSQPAEFVNGLSFDAGEWWRCSTQQKWCGYRHPFEGCAQNPAFKRLKVDNDVGQFRHEG